MPGPRNISSFLSLWILTAVFVCGTSAFAVAALMPVDRGIRDDSPVVAADTEGDHRRARLHRAAAEADALETAIVHQRTLHATVHSAATRLRSERDEKARQLRKLDAALVTAEKRLHDFDEALKAAGIALINHERNASWSKEDSKRSELQALIAALGEERAREMTRRSNLSDQVSLAKLELVRLSTASARMATKAKANAERVQRSKDLLHALRARQKEQATRLAGVERLRRLTRNALAVSHRNAMEQLVLAPEQDDRRALPVQGSDSAEIPSGHANALSRSGSHTAPAFQLSMMPTDGFVIRQFGDDPDDVLGRGITISANPSAPVLAPSDGRIVFAGRFKRYGLLLILDHGNEYHTLLAGLAELQAERGDLVRTGQTVGRLAKGIDSNPRLYLELRRGGMPINPLPWLAARSNRVRG